MQKKVVRVALIGCGRIAAKHIEALNGLISEYEVVALCDVIEDRANEKAMQYKGQRRPAIYTDYTAMIANEEFELGIVATESGAHYEHAAALLDSDRHVIVEKPIALSTHHAEQLIQTAKVKKLLLSVCHQNRFNPPIQALRKAATEKRFGRMINGTARILWTRDQNYYDQAPWRGTARWDGGTLMNQCIHNIDLLLWMMDSPVKSVYAQTGTFLRDIEMEDFGAIILRFENGAIGIVEGSACVYPKNLEETLSIFGEQGTVVIGGLAVNEVKTWTFSETSAEDTKNAGIRDDIASVYGNGHAKLYENVYEALCEGKPLVIDGYQGAAAMNVILAAYQSQKEKRPVELQDFYYSTLEFIGGESAE